MNYKEVIDVINEFKAGFDKNQKRDKDGKWVDGEPKGFENSKVRDKDGNLIKLYHGTNNEFNEFKLSENRFGVGSGVHFSSNIKQAKNYGNIIKEVNLNIKNPMNFAENFRIRGNILKKEFGKTFKTMTINDWVKHTRKIDSLFRLEALKLGFDGVFDKNQPEVIVFDPKQIHIIKQKI